MEVYFRDSGELFPGISEIDLQLFQVRLGFYFDIHFRDSPDSLNGLGISGNNWFRRFAVTYIYIWNNIVSKDLKNKIRENTKLFSHIYKT